MSPFDVLCSRDIPERRKLFAEMVECFWGFGLRIVGTLGTSIVVQRDVSTYADLWTICDSGGEINVERINDSDSIRSIPYTWFGEMVDGATMAYRVRCVLDEDEIEWSRRFDDMIEILVEPERAA